MLLSKLLQDVAEIIRVKEKKNVQTISCGSTWDACYFYETLVGCETSRDDPITVALHSLKVAVNK